MVKDSYENNIAGKLNCQGRRFPEDLKYKEPQKSYGENEKEQSKPGFTERGSWGHSILANSQPPHHNLLLLLSVGQPLLDPLLQFSIWLDLVHGERAAIERICLITAERKQGEDDSKIRLLISKQDNATNFSRHIGIITNLKIYILKKLSISHATRKKNLQLSSQG